MDPSNDSECHLVAICETNISGTVIALLFHDTRMKYYVCCGIFKSLSDRMVCEVPEKLVCEVGNESIVQTKPAT